MSNAALKTDMEEPTTEYRVVFAGKVRDGFEQAKVQAAMVQRLKLSPQQVAALFSGQPRVIKRTHSPAEAKKYILLLANIGAVATVARSGAADAAESAAQKPAAVPDSAEEGGKKAKKAKKVKAKKEKGADKAGQEADKAQQAEEKAKAKAEKEAEKQAQKEAKAAAAKEKAEAKAKAREEAKAARAVKAEERRKAKEAKANEPQTQPPYDPYPNSWLYRPALYGAAAAQVLLNLVHAGVVLWLAYSLLVHQFSPGWVADLVPLTVLAVPVHVTITVLGLIFLFLLTKPLLSLLPRQEGAVPLREEDEPKVYEYIDEVCQGLNVPAPQEVWLSNDASVEVKYLPNPKSVLRQEYVLVVGMPLVAGFDKRAFTALLVQALTVYVAGPAPRANHLLLAVNRWLHRVTHEGDFIDKKLEQWQEEGGRLRAMAIENLIRTIGWSRVAAGWRLELDRQLSARLIQRRIADGDQAAAELVGNEGFRALVEKRRVLTFVSEKTLPALRKSWEENGRLPDNIAMAILARSSQYPQEIHQKLRQQQEHLQLERQDIFPSDQQRFEWLAGEEREAGSDETARAASLFRRFDKLSHRMTMRYYHHDLKIHITSDKLIRPLVKGSPEERSENELKEYFQVSYRDFLPSRLSVLQAQLSAEGGDLMEQWRNVRHQEPVDGTKLQLAHDRVLEAEQALIDASNQEVVARAGLSGKRGKKDGGDQEAIYQLCRDSETELDNALNALAEVMKPAMQRVAAALNVLESSEGVALLANGEQLNGEAKGLLKVLDRVEHQYGNLRALRLQTLLLEGLLSHQSSRKNQELQDRVVELVSDIRQALTGFKVAFKELRYPFSDKREKLLAWLLAESATGDDPHADFDRGNDVVKKTAVMQKMILARLVEIVGELEHIHS